MLDRLTLNTEIHSLKNNVDELTIENSTLENVLSNTREKVACLEKSLLHQAEENLKLNNNVLSLKNEYEKKLSEADILLDMMVCEYTFYALLSIFCFILSSLKTVK